MKIKNFLTKILTTGTEVKNLKKVLIQLRKANGKTVLDIGCGFGKNLKVLEDLGFVATGVDINENLVNAAKNNNFNAISVREFTLAQPKEKFDAILMSHIVEHFEPSHLKTFIETYIKFLKVGGKLIILTPLLSNTFYEDFDHVKPYHPTGFNMVFSDVVKQVQYQSSHTLKLVDIQFRRTPLSLRFCRSLYIPSCNKVPRITNLLFAFLFLISFGIIGKVDGWLGVYQKEN